MLLIYRIFFKIFFFKFGFGFVLFFSTAMVPVQIGVVAQGAGTGTFGRTFIRINGGN